MSSSRSGQRETLTIDDRNEMIQDKDQKIARPRQVYLGHRDRSFVPFERRG